MEVKFEFESLTNPHPNGDARLLEVTIDVWCHDNDGDYGYEDILLWDKDADCEVSFDALSTAEQSQIEALADRHAGDNASEAYSDYCAMQSDRVYAEWKDREVE